MARRARLMTRALLTVMTNNWDTKMIDEFHAKKGKGVGPFGDRLLLLTTEGAKSGETRTTPVAYHRDGDRYVVAASMGAAPKNPAWYHNLVKHKKATIEVGDETFEVKATPLPKGPERDRLYEAHAQVLPMFREYPSKTTRIIPIVVLERAGPR
jgi:deazaflavin-dependent oxidoreductase (nitroreductase family)